MFSLSSKEKNYIFKYISDKAGIAFSHLLHLRRILFLEDWMGKMTS